ncbi:tRNA (guanosine-2'-O-)-methyltransferase [Murinocardiopsis flavida]|uniref:tRNA (Guanosine-2'-O-)-methyltransferase n=1 Tax=Murinocardiopsis flavida TaxID=645275 RepID=A0A2P8DP40_9ACTN|nr:TrmH family RNA methyltransferase [Murinocardiopsis flavida]PSK98994.1 tRNA (guanosine-2'-O-)-methyltransferase [Murinocardiopsis flavida]
MSTQLRPTDVKRLNRQWRRRTEGRIALLVESVTQPFNLGSILRSAAAFGVQTVWLTGNAIDPDHPQVGKTALGSEQKLRWAKLRTSAEAAQAARDDGYRVVAVELTRDAAPLHEAPLDGDICLAVGAEDHGCSPALLAASDARAYIPQIGRVGSLNVAVATAIALAETRRREWQAGADSAPHGATDRALDSASKAPVSSADTVN